ncbi:alanine--tRNA ligase [Williamsia serinedens]|uniref:Alanine--tRNA ligase n=1 Tax=Williamsia serinedens TaxID=391736 RepID=A0ABT1GWN2_9NOCA|nr:alanine--tRNA ligase [Williamsia serinedens]MCP2159159.1 alanyl-tRNA synthetase [Williamsia serinedens]
MQTHEIRKRFLDHFVAAGHTEIPSASLVLDDPNLLFVNAGMVPFKPYFLGERTPESPRATSIQKCVRTLDIEEVGITTRHNTFFQMAGNFSFGDYFKREAIAFAWSLLTNPVADGGFGIDPTRLWPTVYLDDDEAEAIWRDEIGVPAERIQRRGMKDNYWSMGVPGPCGPCSEIFYDRGPEYGVEGGPEADEDRYIEIWNLVFMQNERGEGGTKDDYPILGPLPRPNIDTGMGIERVATILQGVDNVYETDLLKPVIDTAARLTGRAYGAGGEDGHAADVRFRVIADHARTAVMLISDEITPGNDGRGYVLRRLLRRIVRSARLLGADQPTMGDFVDTVIATMSPSYPVLAEKASSIRATAVAEEQAFLRTLADGSKLFDEAVTATRDAGSTVITGSKAFALHDTYGFPIDLTLEMAAEAGLSVDEQGFTDLMAEQRRRAQADAKGKKTGHAEESVYREFLDRGPTEFTGFDELVSDATVLGIVGGGLTRPVATVGDQVDIVLDRTPLYAESGGQMADIGTISTSAGARARVTDVQKVAKSVYRHVATVEAGEFVVGDVVLAAVDPQYRRGATQGHSGTHLVGAALRQVLGSGATQAGSLNRPGYLRFDFRAQGPLSDAQRAEVEDITNSAVESDHEVHTFETGLDEAKAMGAMALFGENYGDRVRVVEIGGPFSMELCGGTHVGSSAQVGPVTLLGESSVASGVRRVEAYVGLDSYRHLARERALLAAVSSTLKVPGEEVPDRVATLVERLRDAEKSLEKLKADAARASAASVLDDAERIGDTLVVAARLADGLSGGDLRALATDLRARLGSQAGIVALFSVTDGKVPFVVALTGAARDAGLSAGAIVGDVAPTVGGRGGGKPDLAQGSGTDPDGIATALARVRQAAG